MHLSTPAAELEKWLVNNIQYSANHYVRLQ